MEHLEPTSVVAEEEAFWKASYLAAAAAVPITLSQAEEDNTDIGFFEKERNKLPVDEQHLLTAEHRQVMADCFVAGAAHAMRILFEDGNGVRLAAREKRSTEKALTQEIIERIAVQEMIEAERW